MLNAYALGFETGQYPQEAGWAVLWPGWAVLWLRWLTGKSNQNILIILINAMQEPLY